MATNNNNYYYYYKLFVPIHTIDPTLNTFIKVKSYYLILAYYKHI